MSEIRNTSQYLIPVEKTEPGKNDYDIYPIHDLGEGAVSSDYLELARRLSGSRNAVI